MRSPDWMTNRQKKRLWRPTLSYCRCDRNQVNVGEKCVVCGRREKARHGKRNERIE